MWDHCEEVHKHDGGKYSAQCAYCAKLIKNKSLQRLKAHFHGRGSVAVCTKLDTPEPIAFEELCILY